MALTAAQRKLRARAAAFAMHAQGGTNTAPAFAARMRKLEDRVDPERTLTPEERARRVRLALQSDMALLALRASRAKTRKAGPADIGPAQPKEGTTDARRPAA